MALEEGTFNMITMQDQELTQLIHQHHQGPNAFKRLNQLAIINLAFLSYTIGLFAFFIMTMSLCADYLNG